MLFYLDFLILIVQIVSVQPRAPTLTYVQGPPANESKFFCTETPSEQGQPGSRTARRGSKAKVRGLLDFCEVAQMDHIFLAQE